jgi:hypothetical protein
MSDTLPRKDRQRHVLTEQVRAWMAEVVNEEPEFHGVPRITYDVSLTALPNGAQEDQWVPFVVMYLAIEGPVADADVFSSPIVRPYAVREQFVKDLTRDGVRSLIETRDAAVAEYRQAKEDRVADSSG